MWLDNLKELKKSTGMSFKQIAEMTNLPERTVARIFSGDTDNPYVDTLHRIVSVLGGSLDSILADSKAVVGTVNSTILQEDIDRLNGEVNRLNGEVEERSRELTLLSAENSILKDKVTTLTAENDLLRIKLEHKEEIISLHNYYNKLKSGT
jgi:transcriptional regulator with XRE-family HTH domain